MKKTYFKQNKLGEDMNLQITSMADIFIIILVFLLKSYATGMTVTTSQGMTLPEAQTSDASVEALKVEVAQNAVLVEGKFAARLTDFRFSKDDIQAQGSSISLLKTLEKSRERQLLIAKANSDVKVDPKILIVADQRVPYVTMKAVLASAATHGYTDFKLAVVGTGGGP